MLRICAHSPPAGQTPAHSFCPQFLNRDSYQHQARRLGPGSAYAGSLDCNFATVKGN